LIERFPPTKGSKVLDVACGWGDTTADLAILVGKSGSVKGVDVAPRFIEMAAKRQQERCSPFDLKNAAKFDFTIADLENDDLRPADGTLYDAVYSRLGTMFFVSPVKAFKNIYAAVKPGGKVHFAVWRKRQDNGFLYTSQKVAEGFINQEDQSDSDVTCGPGPFSQAGPDMVSDQLQAAGFVGVSFMRFDSPMQMGKDLDEALQFTTQMGPAGESIRLVKEKTGKDHQEEIMAEMKTVLMKDIRADGTLWGESSTWLITAVRPEDSGKMPKPAQHQQDVAQDVAKWLGRLCLCVPSPKAQPVVKLE